MQPSKLNSLTSSPITEDWKLHAKLEYHQIVESDSINDTRQSLVKYKTNSKMELDF